MVKVQLKKNLRYFDSDDSDFMIQVGEVLELPEKHLRSYSIKHHLFHGLMEIVEGEFVYKFKAGMIYVAKDTLYCKELDRYFKKDLEYDSITFIAEDEVPLNIMAKLNQDTSAVQETIQLVPEVAKEVIVEAEGSELTTEIPEVEEDKVIDFDSMTKDELKEYIKNNDLEIDKKLKVNDLREALKNL